LRSANDVAAPARSVTRLPVGCIRSLVPRLVAVKDVVEDGGAAQLDEELGADVDQPVAMAEEIG
jgi:hypothetical protein